MRILRFREVKQIDWGHLAEMKLELWSAWLGSPSSFLLCNTPWTSLLQHLNCYSLPICLIICLLSFSWLCCRLLLGQNTTVFPIQHCIIARAYLDAYGQLKDIYWMNIWLPLCPWIIRSDQCEIIWSTSLSKDIFKCRLILQPDIAFVPQQSTSEWKVWGPSLQFLCGQAEHAISGKQDSLASIIS